LSLSFSRSVGRSVGRSIGLSVCLSYTWRPPRFRSEHAGSIGRVLCTDRGQTGTRRTDTGLQAVNAPRVPGHRGGRAVRTVVRSGQASGLRGCAGRVRSLPRPRGPGQRVRVPAWQTPWHAVRDGPLRHGRGRRSRTRGRAVSRHLHVINQCYIFVFTTFSIYMRPLIRLELIRFHQSH